MPWESPLKVFLHAVLQAKRDELRDTAISKPIMDGPKDTKVAASVNVSSETPSSSEFPEKRISQTSEGNKAFVQPPLSRPLDPSAHGTLSSSLTVDVPEVKPHFHPGEAPNRDRPEMAREHSGYEENDGLIAEDEVMEDAMDFSDSDCTQDDLGNGPSIDAQGRALLSTGARESGGVGTFGVSAHTPQTDSSGSTDESISTNQPDTTIIIAPTSSSVAKLQDMQAVTDSALLQEYTADNPAPGHLINDHSNITVPLDHNPAALSSKAYIPGPFAPPDPKSLTFSSFHSLGSASNNSADNNRDLNPDLLDHASQSGANSGITKTVSLLTVTRVHTYVSAAGIPVWYQIARFLHALREPTQAFQGLPIPPKLFEECYWRFPFHDI